MISKFTGEERLNWGERSLVAFIALSLALPFVPVPGDGTMRMKVARRADGTVEPVKAKTQAPKSVCEVLAFSLAYEDPATGGYTRVACKALPGTAPHPGA
ncbi:MAG TPA: hypothetical protein VMU06_13480 [Stellaceae bacterium]|nr:hypothetical protein [Stellaceae bacterium]